MIVWETPPARRRMWRTAAGELESRRGEWGRVAEGLTPAQANSARKALEHHGCKVAQRKIDGHGISVWAMYPETP